MTHISTGCFYKKCIKVQTRPFQKTLQDAFLYKGILITSKFGKHYTLLLLSNLRTVNVLVQNHV